MKKKSKPSVQTKEENLWNIPNVLTAIRVFLTLVILYFIFDGYSMTVIVAGFVVAMLTDFLDGQIARRCNMVTEFGRKFDIIADRILVISVIGGLLLSSFTNDILSRDHVLQIFLTLSREIISFPFVLLMWLANKPLVHARFIGKATTFLQGFTIPAILLSVDYPLFSIIAPLLAWVTFFVGLISGITFIRDLWKEGRK